MLKICTTHRTIMKPDINGVVIEEIANGRPYKLWLADVWTCGRGCRVALTAYAPAAEHYQEDYAKFKANAIENGTFLFPTGN